MDAEHWIIGPQLIGIILLLAGGVQRCYPPKSINSLYGYRTPTSMKNQQQWTEANCYSAKFMVKAGMVLLIVGIVLSILLGQLDMPDKLRRLITVAGLITSSIAACVLLIVKTEKHLSKTFDN
ncbi:SdpI family protein [Mucilaginibacter limnophilus]|uniref:SdpI family protein n=1 Tax=Mucilaginibacter limnophilus TaxID=1932778 RepID=A0A3S2WZ17_9SPHI|nr:SdpI family protein [Mucilaginibacter limnophilus]RVU01480.1 SdpI family protein [Mucilaginibacter limnophilus]